MDELEQMPDYKLCIFAAAYALDNQKRAAILRKLRKNNATALMFKLNLYPCFTVACGESEVVARFCTDNEPAVAVRQGSGFTSVFCGVKYVPADFLRAVAEAAGCLTLQTPASQPPDTRLMRALKKMYM